MWPGESAEITTSRMLKSIEGWMMEPANSEYNSRVVRSGGYVIDGRVRRGSHGINMSKALGDFDFKAPENQVKCEVV